MISAPLKNATRILATDQDEYNNLEIMDHIYDDGTPAMLSLWYPTPEELEQLNAGQGIVLIIQGTTHPPISLTVNEKEPE